MRKKIFLIGSCGFLLSNYLRKNLFHKNYNNFYVGLDNLSEKHSYYNRYQHNYYHFYLGDIRDEDLTKNIFKIEKPDVVIFGASSSKTANDNLSCKLSSCFNLIKLGYDFKISKIIYLGDSSVYGNIANNVDEKSPLNPVDYESSINLSAESLFKEYCSNYIDFNILRISKVYGHRMNPNEWISNFIFDMHKSNDIFLQNQGINEKDYLYIDDFCSALNLLIESGKKNEIYNVSSGESINDLEISNEIYKCFNKDISKLMFSKTDFLNINQKINNFKLKSLNWTPNLKWKQNLKETIDWYNTNKWMYKLHE